jgi:carboxypeptidase PM20D1
VKEIIDDPSITIEAKSWKPSPKVADVNGLGFQRIEAAIQRVLPDTLVTPGLLTASSDTPHYVDLTDNIYRFHPFTTSMVGSQAIHGTDERISLDALHNAVRLSQALIESVAAE